MSTKHAIRLIRSDLQRADATYFGAYRIRIEAVDAVGAEFVDAEGNKDFAIFVYQVREPSPYLGVVAPADLYTIAGPVQMATCPRAEPRLDRGWPFFRLTYLEKDVESQEVANILWDLVVDQKNRLCEYMDLAPELRIVRDEWGPHIPELGSQSESSSA